MSIDINSGNSFVRVLYALLNIVAETGTGHHSLVRLVPMSKIPVLHHMSNCLRPRGFSKHGCGWQPALCKFPTDPRVPRREFNLVEGIIHVCIATLFKRPLEDSKPVSLCRYIASSHLPGAITPGSVTGYGIRSYWHSTHRAASACLYVQVGGHTVLPLQTSSLSGRSAKFCGELAVEERFRAYCKS